MKGLKVGHHSHNEFKTGVTVFLFDQPAVGAYTLCGAAPASHEWGALEADASVSVLHGLALCGGSAYGLLAVAGVMRFLRERNIGLALPHGVVPIVPAAAIYDLTYGQPEPPTAEGAYQACLDAKEENTTAGAFGAGTGATVGKVIPNAHQMTSGIGRAEITLSNGLTVLAYAVVNAVGDVRSANGHIIAGATDDAGQFLNCEAFLLSGKGEQLLINHHTNTTLVAIFTNAGLSRSELKRVGKMAVGGMARAIAPVFTDYDGDTIFTVSMGDVKASVLSVGTIAAEAVRQAIVNAVATAEMI